MKENNERVGQFLTFTGLTTQKEKEYLALKARARQAHSDLKTKGVLAFRDCVGDDYTQLLYETQILGQSYKITRREQKRNIKE